VKIVVVCENLGNSPLELIGKARAIAPQAHIIALYESEKAPLEKYHACGANEAIGIGACGDDCAQGNRIAEAIKKIAPDSALFPATVRGRFLSGWVAAELETGLTADCTELMITEDGLLKQVRPAFGGNLTAEILCKEKRPQMASVRPGVFTVNADQAPEKPLEKSLLSLSPVLERMEKIAFQPVENDVSLQSAKVVIAGGKAIGSKKGFEKLFELAHLLGGAVGATRSAVDAGYIPYAHQIGQTGVTIHPELYIGFGISGLVQHTVGMNSADVVVAVNTDRNAPIFSCADYGIIADWEITIDALIQYLKERKNAK